MNLSINLSINPLIRRLNVNLLLTIVKGITRRRLINQSTNQPIALFEGNNHMLDISGD